MAYMEGTMDGLVGALCHCGHTTGKIMETQQVVVAHDFNHSTLEAEAGGSLSSRPAWSTQLVPGQSRDMQINFVQIKEKKEKKMRPQYFPLLFCFLAKLSNLFCHILPVTAIQVPHERPKAANINTINQNKTFLFRSQLSWVFYYSKELTNTDSKVKGRAYRKERKG